MSGKKRRGRKGGKREREGGKREMEGGKRGRRRRCGKEGIEVKGVVGGMWRG